jgi:hypothetical protein
MTNIFFDLPPGGFEPLTFKVDGCNQNTDFEMPLLVFLISVEATGTPKPNATQELLNDV